MSKRDIIKFEGPQLAWKRALASAKLDLLDLSFVESHDCFTSAELIEYEAMGLTAPGEGERAIHEGWVERDGKLPVNVSGGLKAKGHPVGATGVSMHVMSAMQLSGTAPGGAAAAQGPDRRRVQHGRRRGRQLREHPRAAALEAMRRGRSSRERRHPGRHAPGGAGRRPRGHLRRHHQHARGRALSAAPARPHRHRHPARGRAARSRGGAEGRAASSRARR